MNHNLRRIHHIDSVRNRYFSVPIFLFAFFSLLILLLLPYYGRIAYAFLLNLLFNRLKVYLEYLSRCILKPLRILHVAGAYFLVLSPYALAWRFFGRKSSAGWQGNPPSTTAETMFRQS